MWDDSEYLTFSPTAGVLYFSGTANSGRSWSKPKVLYRPTKLFQVITSEIIAEPHGKLLALFTLDPPARGPAAPPQLRVGNIRLMAMRSADGGRTWTVPGQIALIPITLTKDSTGHEIFAPPEMFGAAADTRGVSYVSWHVNTAGGGAIRIVRSRDGGVHWSRPRTIVHGPRTDFSPTLTTEPAGTVGLMWYDAAADPNNTADWWIARSLDHGQTWRRTHLYGPFPLASAHTTAAK